MALIVFDRVSKPTNAIGTTDSTTCLDWRTRTHLCLFCGIGHRRERIERLVFKPKVQIQLESLFVKSSVAWLVEASVERIRSIGFEPQQNFIFFLIITKHHDQDKTKSKFSKAISRLDQRCC